MATVKKAKRRASVKFGVFELRIPKQHYPHRKNNKAKEFAGKARDAVRKLHSLELELEFCLGNVKNAKSILFSKKRAARPINHAYIFDLSKEMAEFDDNYETYCLRAFIYRETIWKFVAEFLDIESSSFWRFLDDSKIRETGIAKILRAFDEESSPKHTPLKEVISYRNRITHKLSDKNTEKNLDEVLSQFRTRLKQVNTSLNQIIEIHKNVAEKVNTHIKNR